MVLGVFTTVFRFKRLAYLYSDTLRIGRVLLLAKLQA